MLICLLIHIRYSLILFAFFFFVYVAARRCSVKKTFATAAAATEVLSVDEPATARQQRCHAPATSASEFRCRAEREFYAVEWCSVSW